MIACALAASVVRAIAVAATGASAVSISVAVLLLLVSLLHCASKCFDMSALLTY
jgi:hypothetical protein